MAMTKLAGYTQVQPPLLLRFVPILMFLGLAFRIVFDVGLHIDPDLLNLTERETQIRHMVLWASLITDK